MKKSLPFFFRFYKCVYLTPDRKILSFDFYPRVVYFECKFGFQGLPLLKSKTDRFDLRGLDPVKSDVKAWLA